MATQQSVENFQQLYDEIKKYIVLQAEYAKTEVVEKMTLLLSTLLIASLIIIFALGVLFYLCFALAYALEPLLGSLALSFGLISGVYILLIIVLVVFRKRLIIHPLVKFLSGLFLKNEDEL